MSGADHGVVARLAAEVDAGRLILDASQRQAAVHLDRLSAQLRAKGASLTQRLRSRLRWLPAQALRGVYLWGGVGRGKTLLMDFFDATLRDVPRERTHFYRFMRQVHADLRAIGNRSDPLDAVAQRFAARARVICLDEFFVADIADAMILAGLLEGLLRCGVTLVATSNVAPRHLYKDGLQRQRFLPAIDLLEAHVEVVHLDGGVDYRLRQLEAAPTYLDAALVATDAQLAERFAALAGGRPTGGRPSGGRPADAVHGGPTTLSIEERPIVAKATAPGMVWFEFADLCDGPRGQNDYIEIARLYHTVFISHVPVFTAADENAARRFIMLVDELYDRSVNIVVSAAAAPAALYQGETLRFEFERTASRLIEMQTEAYLSGQHRP